MEREALAEVIEIVNSFLYRLNPEEVCSFDKAKKEMKTKKVMSYRNQQFVKWIRAKYEVQFKLTAKY